MSRGAGALVALCLAACGGASASGAGEEPGAERSTTLKGDDGGRCSADGHDRETSEYDTSGDARPDVRKVYRRLGVAPATRLVLVCREADLDADGVKDVVRYYNDEGRPLREEADRDFDGKMDEVVFFEQGQIIRKELDTDADGVVDTKVFYTDGEPLRAEVDLQGRSTEENWKPDRWEYYQQGRMVRMGTDLDGDGRVDRWDRNDELRRRLEAEEDAEQQEPSEAERDEQEDEQEPGPPKDAEPDEQGPDSQASPEDAGT